MKPNGTSLRALRESKHIGLRELARTVGVSHQFLGRLENDEATASVQTMERIADKLEVTVGAIAFEPVTAAK